MAQKAVQYVKQKFLQIGNIALHVKRNIKNSKPMNFENNPHNNDEISQEKFFDDVREIVAKKVSEILGKSEDELLDQEKEFYDKYVYFLTISNIASMESGDYFRNIIPNSMHKPVKEYDQESLFPQILEAEEFKMQNSKNNDSFIKLNEEFRSDVYEEENDGRKHQTIYNRYIRENKINITEEIVDNILTKKQNYPSGILMITDLKSGLRIDLNQMLPDGYYFAPSEMVRIIEDVDLEKGKVIKEFVPMDLNSYKGLKESKDFYFLSGLNEVVYGDLNISGNVITLFHEIAHSWQNVYYETKNKEAFNNFHREVSNNLKILKDTNCQLERGEMTPEKHDKIAKYIIQEISKLGVEFDPNNFIYRGQKIEKGSLMITDFKGDQYVIKCENFNVLKKNFEREERDAWAHALLMLRFLRKRGIDLEPDMKNSEIKGHIENCLLTYRKYIDNKVGIVK